MQLRKMESIQVNYTERYFIIKFIFSTTVLCIPQSSFTFIYLKNFFKLLSSYLFYCFACPVFLHLLHLLHCQIITCNPPFLLLPLFLSLFSTPFFLLSFSFLIIFFPTSFLVLLLFLSSCYLSSSAFFTPLPYPFSSPPLPHTVSKRLDRSRERGEWGSEIDTCHIHGHPRILTLT